jgi:hypothetical protein
MTTPQGVEALIETLSESLPRVGESESVWCMVRGYDLRAAVSALAAVPQPPPAAGQQEPLTEADIESIRRECIGRNSGVLYPTLFARAIEAAHGIGLSPHSAQSGAEK